MQPYVDVYKSFGFRPVRRDFRVGCDLRKTGHASRNELDMLEVNQKTAQAVSDAFVKSIRPYWDWRIEEQGGEEGVTQNFREGLGKGET